MKAEGFQGFSEERKKAIRQHKHFLGLRKQRFKSVYFFTCPTQKNLFSFGMQKASKIKRFEQFLFPNYYIELIFVKTFFALFLQNR